MIQIDDVTDEVSHDVNEEDRVYRVDGVLVKIRTTPDERLSTIGRETVGLTASICDDTGRAHVIGQSDGVITHFVLADPHLLTFCTVMGEEDMDQPDVHEELDRERRRFALHTLYALRRRNALASAPGVGKAAASRVFAVPVAPRKLT